MAVAALKTRHRAVRSQRPPRLAAMLPRRVEREVGLQKLLSTRISDLTLRPEGWLAECVEQVIGELRA
jgi:hypothetical protein